MPSRRQFLALVGLAAAAAGCRRASPSGGGAAPKALRVAVIPKGTTHEFWKSVHAGTVKAARELGVELVWKGPLKEDDLKSQIDLVQSFVAQRISGIVLAPLDAKGLRAPVKDAVRSGIPVVIIDSGLDSPEPVSFVMTDNRAAGRLAGEHMVELLAGQGRVVVLRYQEGSASTFEREEGFLEAVRKAPGVQVVSDNQYSGPTTESAYAASESLLIAQRAAQGDVAGVFAPNESSSFGLLLALDKASLAGKVKFVGFDASTKLVSGLQAGKIHGLVVQRPFEMGYRGALAMVKHLRGEPIEPRVDTGSTLVTAKNLAEPAIRQLVAPDLTEWLGAGG